MVHSPAQRSMANKPRRRQGRRINPQNYRNVMVNDVLGLVTLNSVTAIRGALVNGAEDTTIISSAKVAFAWDDMTGTGGNENEDGPLIVGLTHGDYTVTEIKEFIESLNSMSWSDKIAAERSRRLIRVCGFVHAMKPYLPMKKYKLNWKLEEGVGLHQFAYNTGGAQLTTGSQLHCIGNLNAFRA